MKAKLLALALGAALSAPAFAHVHIGDCGVRSDYSLSIKPDRLVFKRSGGTPTEVEIADGTLRVDGKLVATNDADARRLRDAEREVRSLVPEVKAIAREAIAIAFTRSVRSPPHSRTTAMPRATAQSASRASAARSIARIADADSFEHWQDADIDRLVESTVEAVVPEIVGNVTAEALKVAFTGDEAAAAALEARAEGIERSVERAVEKQAAELEGRAMSLCPRLRALDRVENDLDLRLSDGSRLDLVRVY